MAAAAVVLTACKPASAVDRGQTAEDCQVGGEAVDNREGEDMQPDVSVGRVGTVERVVKLVPKTNQFLEGDYGKFIDSHYCDSCSILEPDRFER